MNRSLVISFVGFVAFVAATAIATRPYWGSVHPWWVLALLQLAIVFGAGVTAASLSRLIEPARKVPALVWLAIAPFWVMSLLGAAKQREAEGRFPHETPSSTPLDENRPMGRVRAAFAMLLGLVYAGGGIAGMYAVHHGIIR